MAIASIAGAARLLTCLGLSLALAGCWVHVDKDADGQEKHVRVDTPFGGVHVDTGQTDAADLGLPTYPGSTAVTGDNNQQSADVQVGFGEWALRVRVASYETPDAKDKVIAFYKKALGRYSDVLTCQDDEPVGMPARTSEGLTCAEHQQPKGMNVNAGDYKSVDRGFQLKAGSERHQHIVSLNAPVNGQTRFSLVAIDLPSANMDESKKSN